MRADVVVDLSHGDCGKGKVTHSLLDQFDYTHCLRYNGGGNAGQVFQLYYEGEFGTDTYDGTNSETFAAYLQTELRLLTSVGAGSVNLSSATVGAQAL